MDLAEIAAHLEIQQVLYRYCRAVDRGDAALLESVYHPGAVDNHGAFHGTGAQFAAMLVPLMDASPRVGQHHITNILIDLAGDAADVESYFMALHPAADGSHIPVNGRYLDRFARRDGRWAITERNVVVDWSGPAIPWNPWGSNADYPQGGRRERDPSHRP